MSKEKNITSGEIEGMYEYISDIILKNSKVINKKEIKVKRRNNDGKSEEKLVLLHTQIRNVMFFTEKTLQ